MRVTDIAGANFIYSRRTGSGVNDLEFFWNLATLNLETLNGVNVTAVSGAILTDENWHYVYGVRTGQDVAIYFDGTQVASGSGPVQDLTCVTQVLIGSNTGGTNNAKIGRAHV